MEKRLLTIQDISCVGQCSATVALPIISACGIETAVLPSAVLSNHTSGFSGWTFCDLTDQMSAILERWKKEGLDFDTFYTGYITMDQIPHILDIMDEAARPEAIRIIDPVMGDYGKMYSGFNEAFPSEMKKLVRGAYAILPNMTEASLLLGEKYSDAPHTEERIENILERLAALGADNIVLKGVSFEPGKIGVACFDGKKTEYYFTQQIGSAFHGTGDAYASVFSGALTRGLSVLESASLAADFIVETIRHSIADRSDWYGIRFEKALPYLMKRLEEK